jgi:hypothetical protein
MGGYTVDPHLSGPYLNNTEEEESMGVTSRLVFDPTDANTIAASSAVGAFVRAGDDGTLIGHVSDALKVSFTNTSLAVTATDLDIRDLAYATDSVTAHQGGTWDIGTVGSITGVVSIDDNGGSITVDGTVAATQSGSWTVAATQSGSWTVTATATDLDIRDLVAASDSVSSWTKDGSGNAITSTSGALDVNITNAISINDAALANTAIDNNATAVSTSAVAVTASVLASRKYLFLANNGPKAMYVGKTGVTTANGFPMFPGERIEMRAGASVGVFAIGGAGSSNEDLRCMQLA